MEILRKNKNEMLKTRNTVTEMKSACGEFISRLDTAEERISELENMTTETCKLKAKKKKE